MYGQLSLEHRVRFGLNGNGAPNNASSQTKNYEITPFIHSGVTEGSYHSSLFSCFPRGLEKTAIKRISLMLPSRTKKGLEILSRERTVNSFWRTENPFLGRTCNFFSRLEMGAGLKKDLRVSRVGPGGSLNAFFFLLIGVISQRLATVIRKKGGTSTLGERSTTESCMLRSGRMNRSQKGIY